MNTESTKAKIEVDFKLAAPGPDKLVEADEPSELGVRELARTAAAELEPRLRPIPRLISDALGEALSLAEAAEALGWTEEQVQSSIDERQLLAHSSDMGTPLVPAFQLTDEPSISPAVSKVLEMLGPVCEDPRMLLAWFCAPKDELSQQTPATWISSGGEPEPVVLAARRDAARLS